MNWQPFMNKVYSFILSKQTTVSEKTHFQNHPTRSVATHSKTTETRFVKDGFHVIDGHVGAQSNSKLWLFFCIIKESNSEKTFFLVCSVHQHGA